MKIIQSKFSIGAIVRHRIHDFRGVVFDVDPEFDNSDEWYQSIPAEKRPKKISHFIICSLKTLRITMLRMSRNKI